MTAFGGSYVTTMATVHSASGQALPGAQIAAAIARFRSAPPMPRERRKVGVEPQTKFWWEKDATNTTKDEATEAKLPGKPAMPAWFDTPLPAAVTMSGNPLEPRETTFRPDYGSLNSSINSIAPPPPRYPPASNISATSPAADKALDSSAKSAIYRRRCVSCSALWQYLPPLNTFRHRSLNRASLEEAANAFFAAAEQRAAASSLNKTSTPKRPQSGLGQHSAFPPPRHSLAQFESKHSISDLDSPPRSPGAAEASALGTAIAAAGSLGFEPAGATSILQWAASQAAAGSSDSELSDAASHSGSCSSASDDEEFHGFMQHLRHSNHSHSRRHRHHHRTCLSRRSQAHGRDDHATAIARGGSNRRSGGRRALPPNARAVAEGLAEQLTAFREKHASAMRAAGEVLGSSDPFPDTPFDELMETLADKAGEGLLPPHAFESGGGFADLNGDGSMRSFMQQCSGISEGLDVAMLCLRRRLDGVKGGSKKRKAPKKRIMKAIVGRLLGKLGHIPSAPGSVSGDAEGGDENSDGGGAAAPQSRFAALVAGIAARSAQSSPAPGSPRSTASHGSPADADKASPGDGRRPKFAHVRPLSHGGAVDKSAATHEEDDLSAASGDSDSMDDKDSDEEGGVNLPGLKAAIAMSQELQDTQAALDNAGGLPPLISNGGARGLERDLGESTGSLRRALVEAGLLLPPPRLTDKGVKGGPITNGIDGPTSDPGGLGALGPAGSPDGPAWAHAAAQWEARGRNDRPADQAVTQTAAQATAAAEDAEEDAPEPPLAAPWTELQQRALGNDPDSALPFIGDPLGGKEVPPATLQAAAAPAAPVSSLRPPWNPHTTFLPLTEATAAAQGMQEAPPGDATQHAPPSPPTGEGSEGPVGEQSTQPSASQAGSEHSSPPSHAHDIPDPTIPPAARAAAGPGGSMPYAVFMAGAAPPPPQYNMNPSNFLPAAPLVADLVYRPRAEVSEVRDSNGNPAGVAFPPWAVASLAVNRDAQPYSKFNFKDPETEEALDAMTQGGRRGMLLAREDGSLEAVQQPPGTVHVPQPPSPPQKWQRAPPQSNERGYQYAPTIDGQQTQLQQMFEQFMAYQEHRHHAAAPQVVDHRHAGSLAASVSSRPAYHQQLSSEGRPPVHPVTAAVSYRGTAATELAPSGLSQAPMPMSGGGVSPSGSPDVSSWVPASSAVHRGPYAAATWAHPPQWAQRGSANSSLASPQQLHMGWAHSAPEAAMASPYASNHAHWAQHSSGASGHDTAAAGSQGVPVSAPGSTRLGGGPPGSWPSTVTPLDTPREGGSGQDASGAHGASAVHPSALPIHSVQRALQEYSAARSAGQGHMGVVDSVGGVNPAAWRGTHTSFAPELLRTGAQATLNMSALHSQRGSGAHSRGLMLSADEGFRRSEPPSTHPSGLHSGAATVAAGQPWWQAGTAGSQQASVAMSAGTHTAAPPLQGQTVAQGHADGARSPTLTAEGAAVATARAALAASAARRQALAVRWGAQ